MSQSVRFFTHGSAARCFLGAALLTIALAGCGGTDAPTTYQLSGRVTFDGQPVPNGTITLSPDTEKGNRGPGTAAGIVAGRFVTEPGKGHIGGAYVLQVSGYDGVPVEGGEGTDTAGTPLFSLFEMQVELPKADAEQDVEVPSGAPDAS